MSFSSLGKSAIAMRGSYSYFKLRLPVKARHIIHIWKVRLKF
jgi:hypothetical protein